MTGYKFKVGASDFSDMVYSRGYKTDRIPVYGRSVKTQDGVTHRVKLRDRGQLVVYLNSSTLTRASQLCTALLSNQSITYTSLQSNTDVTETMELDSMPIETLVKASQTQWIKGFELVFVQK